MAGRFVKQATIDLYQDYIGDLIADLAREVTVYGKPTEVDCEWCIWDPVNKKSSGIASPGYTWSDHDDYEGAARCPNCKGEGTVDTESTTTIDGTIAYKNHPEFHEGEIGIFKPGTVRVKCLLTDALVDSTDTDGPTIFDNAVKVQIDGYYYDVTNVKKGGLRDLFTCEVYLERIN